MKKHIPNQKHSLGAFLTIALCSISLLFSGCSTTKSTGSWKNTEYPAYTPQKVLVIGITQNLTARKIFEEQLVKELQSRGTEAGMGSDFFPVSFTGTQQSEVQIQKKIDTLRKAGFDAVLISAVKSVDEKISYNTNPGTTYFYYGRFRRYYFAYQNIYYTPYYYEKYKVYHVESSLFDLKDRLENTTLIWTAGFDVSSPQNIQSSVHDYIKKLIAGMEKEKLIPRTNP